MDNEDSALERYLENLVSNIPTLLISFVIAVAFFWNANLIGEYIAAFLGYLLLLVFVWYFNRRRQIERRLKPIPPDSKEYDLQLIIPSNKMRAHKEMRNLMTARIRNSSNLQLEFIHLGVQCLSDSTLLKMLRVVSNNQSIPVDEDQKITGQIASVLDPTQREVLVQLAFIRPSGSCPLRKSLRRASHMLDFFIYAKSCAPPKMSNSARIQVECDCDKR